MIAAHSLVKASKIMLPRNLIHSPGKKPRLGHQKAAGQNRRETRPAAINFQCEKSPQKRQSKKPGQRKIQATRSVNFCYGIVNRMPAESFGWEKYRAYAMVPLVDMAAIKNPQ